MLNKIYRQGRNATAYSIDGMKFLFRSEFAARLEVYAIFWVLMALVFLGVPAYSLLCATILFLVLLAFEAVNTAVEVVIDRVSPEISETGKHAKDLGSFAVMCLITANFIHLLYVLFNVDWEKAMISAGHGWGALFISGTFLLFAIYAFTLARIKKMGRWLIAFALFLYALAIGAYRTASVFTGAGVDESVFYHLKVGVGGSGLSEYTPLIMFNVVFIILSAAIVWLICDIIGPNRLSLSKRISTFIHWKTTFRRRKAKTKVAADEALANPSARKLRLYGTLALAIGLILNPLSQNLYRYFKSSHVEKAKFEKNHAYEVPKIARLKSPKNIIYIYMESLERTYFDTDLFPDLVPNLKALEQTSSYTFTDLNHVHATGFTIGGIVASQCGTPLLTPSRGNTMGNYDQFLPGAICLGDVLDANNYDLHFMGGADLDFAGKGKFFETHGFSSLTGKSHYLAEFPDAPEKFNSWGLYDDSLFEQVDRQFDRLSKSNRPFGLFVLTLDTHHPYGHTSPSCESKQYGVGDSQLLNAVNCADSLISNFINKVRQSPIADNTLIVIGSDHLALENEVSETLKTGLRRNSLLIIDPSQSDPQTIDRKGSLLDIAPTILGLLGSDKDSLGWGRNLLSSAPTLLETLPKRYNQYLIQKGKTVSSILWSYPRFDRDAHINLSDERIEFGDRWLKLPIVIEFNSLGKIAEFDFDHSDPAFRDGYLEGKIPDTNTFLWIDNCNKITQSKIGLGTNITSNWCAAYGSQIENSIQIKAVRNKDILEKSDIFGTQ